MKPNTNTTEIAALKRQVKELSTDNARLEAELRFKDEFFSGMNHELRTPLNAILGLTEALSEQVMGALNERQIRLLGGIDQSGRAMLTLIGDVFDVARSDGSDLPLQLDSISAESLHSAILRLIKPNLYKHGVKLESAVSAEMPYFLGDQRRLKHMLFTLLTAAVRSAKKGDTIQLEVVSSESNRTIVFRVFNADATNAAAAPSEQQEYADITGLIAVAQTADQHGGSIRVNEVGSGREYVVTLPWRGLPSGSAVGADVTHSETYKDLREESGASVPAENNLQAATAPATHSM